MGYLPAVVDLPPGSTTPGFENRPGDELAMSERWTDLCGGGDSSQDFTQATQEESALGKSLIL